MVKEIHIYVEGGRKGKDKYSMITLQQGFNAFLKDIRKKCRLHLITCGSRDTTYKDFMRSVKEYPESFSVLLVDSETEVIKDKSPKQHLQDNDKWDLSDVEDNQCHLMAQIMETWFIADIDSLKRYYGKGFNAKKVRKTADIEKIAKDDVLQDLKNATRNTKSGKYDKKYAAEILEIIDSAKVRTAAKHCQMLFSTLETKIDE